MTRRATPRHASAVTCRWCGGAHSIHECPAVVAAFEPVGRGRPTARRTVKPKPASQVYNPFGRKPERKPAAHSNPSRRPRMPIVRKCARCGQPMECTSNRQKYHPACSADANRENSRRRSAARRATLPPRPVTIRACARCGKLVGRNSNRQKYCSTCAVAVDRENSRKWMRAKRAQQNSQ